MYRKACYAFHIVVLCLILANGGTSYAKQFASVGTNPVGMALYTMGAALTEVLQQEAPDIELSIEATNGGVHNLNLMAKGDVEFGFTAPQEALDAYTGQGRYKKKIPILAMFSTAIAYQQCPSLVSSSISSIAELKDKRVGIGPPGSLSRVDCEKVLSAYGLTSKDFIAFSETLPEMVEKMKNGQLDSTMWFGVQPLAPLMDLAQSRDIVWLGSDPEKMAPLIKKYPYYFLTSLPANTYPKQTKPVPALAQRYSFVVRSDAPEELVYQITRAVFKNFKKLGTIYKGWETCSKETALQSLSIPLHPGAIRYFREINLPGLDEYIKNHPAK